MSKKTYSTDPQNFIARIWRKYKSRKDSKFSKKYSQIERIVLFVGYGRSGHTLIGSLLDAHPEAMIAHELDVLYYFINSYSPQQIYNLVCENALEFTRKGREWMGYSYSVPNQMQGDVSTLKVIGDKSGARSSRRLEDSPGFELLDKIVADTGKKLQLIHIIRNPYDNITTMMNRTAKRREINPTADLLKIQIDQYLKRLETNQALVDYEKYEVLNVKFEQFVADPKSVLLRMCDFLNITSTESYLNDCASIVWANPKKSRNSTELWTKELINETTKAFSKYDFLKGYSFEN